jgi:hypothetical protein
VSETIHFITWLLFYSFFFDVAGHLRVSINIHRGECYFFMRELTGTAHSQFKNIPLTGIKNQNIYIFSSVPLRWIVPEDKRIKNMELKQDRTDKNARFRKHSGLYIKHYKSNETGP